MEVKSLGDLFLTVSPQRLLKGRHASVRTLMLEMSPNVF